MPLLDAVVSSCRIRLRPILMTSLATVIGLMPMALKLGTGSEAYAPLARAIIGGLIVSVALTVFIVPAAYLLVYRRRRGRRARRRGHESRRSCWPRSLLAPRRRPPAQTGARRCRCTRPRRARCRTIRRSRPASTPRRPAGEVDARGAVGVLSDRRTAASPAPRRKDGSRITAGGLNNPIILDRVAAGVVGVAAGDRLRPHLGSGADARRCARRRSSRTRSPTAPTCCCGSIAPTSTRCARRRSCASRRRRWRRASWSPIRSARWRRAT